MGMKPDIKPCKVCGMPPALTGRRGFWRFHCLRRFYADHDETKATSQLLATQKLAAEDWNRKQDL